MMIDQKGINDMFNLKLTLYDEENCESFVLADYVQLALNKVYDASVTNKFLQEKYYDNRDKIDDLSCEELYDEFMHDVLIRAFISIEKSINDYTYFLNSKQ